jgi:DNA-binding MurR/RpiR family transcriptional regulator
MSAPEAPPKQFEELKNLLIARRGSLPRRIEQVAAFALAHPDEIAFGTVATVAQLADVQPSTLIRFAQSLGYQGFSDLQEVFRGELRTRWPDYRERLAALRSSAGGPPDAERAVLSGFAEAGRLSIERLRTTLPDDKLDAAAAILAAADTVHLVGLRRAFPITTYLAYALGKLGLRAALIDHVGALGPEQMAGSNGRDALVAISFTPYTPMTVELTARAAERGMPVVAITDSAFSPLAPHARVLLEVVEADFAGFRSLSASFCLAGALAVTAAARREGTAEKA